MIIMCPFSHLPDQTRDVVVLFVEEPLLPQSGVYHNGTQPCNWLGRVVYRPALDRNISGIFHE